MLSGTNDLQLPLDPDTVKGFLHPDEGQCLYQLALEASALGPCLEVGSYCGKSTLYLGTGARDANGLLYALDHHRGSEEHQLGEEYHDPDLYDAQLQKMDSLPTFRRTLALAQLESVVVPIVASSAQAGRFWQTPLALVFVDGGHSQRSSTHGLPYLGWAPYHRWLFGYTRHFSGSRGRWTGALRNLSVGHGVWLVRASTNVPNPWGAKAYRSLR